jgi:hypothetical protein
VTANVPPAADVQNGVSGKGAGASDMEHSLGCQLPVADNCGRDGFLNGFLALFSGELGKLNHRVLMNGGQDVEETGLPIGDLCYCTHGTALSG